MRKIFIRITDCISNVFHPFRPLPRISFSHLQIILTRKQKVVFHRKASSRFPMNHKEKNDYV